MKYLGNIVSKTLSNTDHISNRIRLTAAAMFKLNDSGYDQSLDVMTIIQLYKTYAIDASKAFDKVNRVLLWLTLYNKIGHTLTTSLINYYSISKAYVLLDGTVSSIFMTTIGIKQGGPLSPRLFAIYFERIVEIIDESGLGIEVMKYLGNIVSKTLSNTDHISNRIRLTAAAMFKLNDSGYDESLDVMTIIQLYKTYAIDASKALTKSIVYYYGSLYTIRLNIRLQHP